MLFEEKPENPIAFAGQFFDDPKFRQNIQDEIKKEKYSCNKEKNMNQKVILNKILLKRKTDSLALKIKE